MSEVIDIDVKYMAGFFDADGNVNLREGNGDAIRFANTNKDVLILMKKFFGGNLYTKGKPIKNYKQGWDLTYHGRYGVSLAKSMFPFLHVKKEKLGKFIERNEKNAEGL